VNANLGDSCTAKTLGNSHRKGTVEKPQEAAEGTRSFRNNGRQEGVPDGATAIIRALSTVPKRWGTPQMGNMCFGGNKPTQRSVLRSNDEPNLKTGGRK
jgi:hypothetical protein